MCMERCYIEAGNPGHKAKSVYSSYESRIVAASNKPENYTGACLCSLWQQLWSVNLVCWEERAASHFLLGSHNPIHIHWIRMTTGMALNTHWTLPTEFSEYSYEIYTIVLPFLQVSKLRHKNINSSKAAQLADGVTANPLFRFRKLSLHLILNTATLCTDHISS